MATELIDLGDALPNLSVTTYNSSGTPENATAVTLVITKPDGTTVSPTVTAAGSGVYTASYTPLTVGRFVATWVATGANASALTTVYNVADPAAGIVALVDAQTFLNATRDSEQDEVRACLLVASDAVENYVGRTYRRTTVTETYDGGKTTVSLRSTPVISVTTVTESGTTVASTGYVLDSNSGVLYRGTTRGAQWWLPGVQNVTVTYVAGATSIPQPVVYATKQVLSALWADRPGGGRKTQPDDYAEAANLATRNVRFLLDPYKAPGF